MNWQIKFIPEAKKDYDRLAGNQQLLVAKALEKVRQNPVSIYEGGYGKPLGNKGGTNLTGLFKVKLKAAELRIVYKLIQTETEMLIIVIGACADDEVYQIAQKRSGKKHSQMKKGLHCSPFFIYFFGNTNGSCRYTNTRYAAMKHQMMGSHRMTAL